MHWILHSVGALRTQIINYHKAAGFSTLIFLVIRIYWRATNPLPTCLTAYPNGRYLRPTLYFFLTAIPLSGYIDNSGGVNYVFFRISTTYETGFVYG